MRRGTPQAVEELTGHSLIGFNQRESLSHRPLRHPLARACSTPSLWASSDETMRQLALACLSSLMTARRQGCAGGCSVLCDRGVLQPIHAVYDRNTALAARIAWFLDYLSECLAREV